MIHDIQITQSTVLYIQSDLSRHNRYYNFKYSVDMRVFALLYYITHWELCFDNKDDDIYDLGCLRHPIFTPGIRITY